MERAWGDWDLRRQGLESRGFRASGQNRFRPRVFSVWSVVHASKFLGGPPPPPPCAPSCKACNAVLPQLLAKQQTPHTIHPESIHKPLSKVFPPEHPNTQTPKP